MTIKSEATVAGRTSATWRTRLNHYRDPNVRRSFWELGVTVAPFIVAWSMAMIALRLGHIWLYALLLAPTAGLVVRLFMIQHDCGHGAFFKRRLTNDWTGRLISIVTLMPYDHWRLSHAVHHATSGNLDRRGVGDVDTLTKAEYLALTRLGRFAYRLYRAPLVLFGAGPIYLFLLHSRLPVGAMRNGSRWASTMATNAAIAFAAGLTIWLVGVWPFILVHGPILLIASTAGVWLFYVQHQFEGTHWSRNESWSVHEAALSGSSYYDLPGVLRWFTANIGLHHLHHTCSRIPFYRLPEALRDNAELRQVGRVSMRESLRCTRFALWDEDRLRLISFRELRIEAKEGRAC